jgi:arginyl-tRNA synthetase
MIREQVKSILNIANAQIERPERRELGDFSTSAALKLGKAQKENPMSKAQEIADRVMKKNQAKEIFSEIKVAPPGFINFYLSTEILQKELLEILEKKEEYGKNNFGQGKKVSVEFISANPTGPLTLGNGRGGFYGDVLANVLVSAGYKAKREYFINDAGYQVEVLGHSKKSDNRAQYKLDDWIMKLDTTGMGISETGSFVANQFLINSIKPTVIERMKINFDEWVSEKELKDSGKMDKVFSLLKEKGLTYEQDGATWFKSTEFGDDKDRVLITSEKEDREQSATYILPDAAYHYKKFTEDKNDLAINIWGADHHGYIARLQAMGKALEAWSEKNLKIVIMQLVRLFEGGKEVKMSKRAGTYITIDELLDEIPLDVARWFFLMRSPDTHMDFDLDLAKEQSEKNPVYYAQYAYARICAIMRKAKESDLVIKSLSDLEIQLLVHQSEIDLIKELTKFPEIIEDTALDYQVHRLPQYALDLVRSFHKFYEDCKVLDENNKELTQARLALCEATKIVLANTFSLMGISAPEKM